MFSLVNKDYNRITVACLPSYHCRADKNENKQIVLSSVVVCSDDKHSDRHSERHRPVCLFFHADSRSCRGGRHSYVTCQHLPPVRLSHLDHAHPGLGVCKHVNLRNSHHCTGTLHRRHLSNVVQCKNELLGVFTLSGPSFLYLPSCCQAWLQPRPIDLSLVWHTPWRLRSLHVLALRQVFFHSLMRYYERRTSCWSCTGFGPTETKHLRSWCCWAPELHDERNHHHHHHYHHHHKLY